jgi:PAS domain S-box-containing protein
MGSGRHPVALNRSWRYYRGRYIAVQRIAMGHDLPPRAIANSAARPYALLVATIAAGVVIFVLDTITHFELAVPVLYVAVVLVAARFLQPGGVALVALACVAAAVASHLLTSPALLSIDPLLNLLMGLAAIGIATYLALLNRSAEVALERQAGLLDSTHDTIFVRDMNDVITYWNRGAEDLYGWKREEALGKVTHDLLQTKFPAPLDEIRVDMFAAGRWEGELVHRRRDGTQVTVASRWSPQWDEGGRPVGILETNNDISQRKRVEDQLRQSEQRYRNIFQTAGVSIWEEDFSRVKDAIDDLKAGGVSDFEMYLAEHPEFVRQAASMVKVIDVNDVSVKLFEAKDKDELLTSLENIFTVQTYGMFAGELVAVFEGRSPYESETVLQTLKRRKLSVLLTVAFAPERPRLDSVLVSIMDITAARQAEEKLQQARAELAHMNRVTTLGEMTASISHEVNQPLAAVVNAARACLRWLDRSTPNLDEARRAAEWIIKEGNRAAEVIRRVGSLAKNAEPRKEPLDVNIVIDEVRALVLRELATRDIRWRLELAPDLPMVLADRVQLQQVIINLVMNGVEAMQPIADRSHELVVRSYRDEARGVVVEVVDSGTGIPADSADKLFNAFFTTKSSGMGMGLSICRSIIEAHGGRLSAANNPGAGARFQFTLPSHYEEAA